ncbi:unnamed protein product [Ceratitis capitata]|uniref:(Mediterranean fruit fly) hypothetical protein n=1 Tax=Ceratitis capitata TaxID=7213 RepID=A0A811UT40_CERCA|nr:unnamed protein product [Ceratitis capitata]
MHQRYLNVDCGVWRVYYEQNTSSIVVSRFKEGRENVNDNGRPGRPITSNVKVLLTVFSTGRVWFIMNSCQKVVRSIRNTT